LVLPLGDPHVLVDSRGSRAEPLESILACQSSDGDPGPLVYGGGGEPVTLICGYFELEAGAVHPLFGVLPPVILLRGEGGHASSWLESTLDLIAEESTAGRPGGETLVDRLTEAMFIQVLRGYLDQQGTLAPSWLAGLRDQGIGRALGLIHRRPDARWTVEELASRAGMSRTSFSTRFRDLVGEPPLQYLTRWRMQVAAGRLRRTDSPLPEIAGQVGYQTEASFSKVFKKLWGISPGAYRRGLTPAAVSTDGL
jgi:AraC-like DNA-binding protein